LEQDNTIEDYDNESHKDDVDVGATCGHDDDYTLDELINIMK
jgi:hypothetical protein